MDDDEDGNRALGGGHATVGKAGGGKAREGDQIRFQSPAGWREIEVLCIEYKSIEA